MTETQKLPAEETASASPAERPGLWAIVGAILVILLVAGAIAGLVIMNQHKRNHDLAQARSVADKAIAAIQKRDGQAARAIGTKSFKSMYTDKQLTDQFKAVEVATSQAPKLDKQYTGSLKSQPAVYDIYAYTRLKVPFYVRTTVVKESGTWKLANITGNVDRTKVDFQN